MANLNLQQKQTLQQKLSPQQIQYIKLLQLPTLALEQRIKAELETNPLLEEGEEPEEEELDLGRDEEPRANDDTTEDDERNEEEEFDWDEFLNSPDDLYGYKAAPSQSEDDDREARVPAHESLVESLREQVHLLDLDETEELIAEQIIGSIAPDGYLRRPLESVADDLQFNQGLDVSEEEIEHVLKRVQRLDPVGIAARDLRECLLLQLEALPNTVDGRENAVDLIRDHFKDFSMKHFEAIMRKMGIEEGELKEAFDIVRHLDPKPGEGTASGEDNYVTPDFFVVRDGDEFRITLNRRNAPELRINRHYRTMWNRLRAKERSNGKEKETKDFLKSRLESARWFITSVQQRRQTLMRVMEAIVRLQEDFFLHGEGRLKPMILNDVAEVIDMDISTVSRVVNGKYVQTEFGVYELKHFFSEGVKTDSGEEVSNREVKAVLERIVQEEDKTRPLSDQKLVEALKAEGYPIARRTVAKYRDQQDIPVARLRKQIVLDEADGIQADAGS